MQHFLPKMLHSGFERAVSFADNRGSKFALSKDAPPYV